MSFLLSHSLDMQLQSHPLTPQTTRRTLLALASVDGTAGPQRTGSADTLPVPPNHWSMQLAWPPCRQCWQKKNHFPKGMALCSPMPAEGSAQWPGRQAGLLRALL